MILKVCKSKRLFDDEFVLKSCVYFYVQLVKGKDREIVQAHIEVLKLYFNIE